MVTLRMLVCIAQVDRAPYTGHFLCLHMLTKHYTLLIYQNLSNCCDFISNNISYLFCIAPLTTTVNCTNGELRLRGGNTSREGRVEMCYERQWGTVCDRYWGTNDAKVACRQLGFSSYGNLFSTTLTFKFD